MKISEVQLTIDSLEHAFPKGFVFVLDSTDRSFMYKSSNRHDCSSQVIRIDQQHGIDKLMKDSSFLIREEDKNKILLKKLGVNSFLGVCLLHMEYDDEILNKVKEILIK